MAGLRSPPLSFSPGEVPDCGPCQMLPPEWGLPFLAIESLFSVGSGWLRVRGQSSASTCSGGGRATASPPLLLHETCSPNNRGQASVCVDFQLGSGYTASHQRLTLCPLPLARSPSALARRRRRPLLIHQVSSFSLACNFNLRV